MCFTIEYPRIVHFSSCGRYRLCQYFWPVYSVYVQCTVCSVYVECAVCIYSVQCICTVPVIQSTVYSVQWALYIVQCTVYSLYVHCVHEKTLEQCMRSSKNFWTLISLDNAFWKHLNQFNLHEPSLPPPSPRKIQCRGCYLH